MQKNAENLRLLRYMPFVADHAHELKRLGEWWQKITLIGKINSHNVSSSLIDDMETTRLKFKDLQGNLIASLVHENTRKIEQEIAARAQVAIDILIRNLFERTADVGFLATDDDLRAFLRQAEPAAGERDAVVRRLREYKLKYSVYDEIIVTDTRGRVRVHLDQDNPVTQTTDQLLAETLNTSMPYVEFFGHSDLQPRQKYSLIYACRIHERNVPQAPVLGALFLCFRFQDEMESIFANLARHGALLAILDRHQRVIASSDAQLLPIESVVETVFDERARIVKFGRQDYLAKTAKTKGYQGYFGSGWMGHIMVPASAAFHIEAGKLEFDAKLLKSSRLFSQDLHNISRTASLVNDDLILSVINGQVDSARRNAVEFLPILEAVRSIGRGTREVFDTSINTLYRTVTSSLLSDVQFQAGLAADIMDRNLYERANDVRWWALTSRFREIMAGDRIDEAARADLSGILQYINGLYTVYTNLFIYDTHGMIVAVSNPGEMQLIGSHVGDEERVRATLLLRDSQQYRVSPFAPTALYAGRHTYVYHAPVAAPADDRRMVGGIGIVFDSEPQFLAMLNDALPRNGDGSVPEGCFGVLVERGSRIVSSTVAQLPPGSTMEIDQRFFALRNGEHLSAIIVCDGRPYAVGAAISKGYREYKTTNDYENDILALIFVAI